jgi:hypothetical protein
VRQRWKRLDGSADGELRFCFEGLGDKLNVGVKGREVSKIPKFGGRSEGIKKKKIPNRRCWFMPVILSTQEAEIRRIAV